MSLLDWSSNGTIADEAMWIGTFLTFATAMVASNRRVERKVTRIDSTLNGVNEPEPDDGPTLGQRVAKIDRRVDRLDHKMDDMATALRELTHRMLDHINDEARRASRLEERVAQLDRRRWDAEHDANGA
jgi:predicted transcriptional regulator